MKRITIQDLCDTVRGVSYKPGDVVRDQANGVPILRASNIQNGEIVFDDLIFVKSNAVRAEQYLQPGDVLICGSSGSPELVGKAAPFSSAMLAI
jgi:type I restriction enzyme S subunit